MKKTILLLLVSLSSITIDAQNNNDDFQSFRKGIMDNYQGYRKSVLDNYEKFLNGIWEDYQAFAGKKSNTLPKPDKQPIAKKDEPNTKPEDIEPEVITPVNNKPGNNTPPNKKDTEPTPPKPQAPKPIVVPTVPNPLAKPKMNMIEFEWCGMSYKLPDANIKDNLRGVEKEDIVTYFEILQNSIIGKEVMPQLETISNTANLNDWCLYLMIESYVKKLKASADTNTRNIICWYMMANAGFDVRITLNGEKLFYLIPFQQQIYARNYLLINNNPYYIWGEGNAENSRGFYTPAIPDAKGKFIDATIKRPLNIQYRSKTFTHTFSGKTLSVEVNENLITIMSKFPQLPITSYASSQGDTEARKQLLRQMKQFVNGMSETEAADFILKFIQSFDYATDPQQFGYEKPFFVEECLYYPKCDCEDRSVLYYYIITQVLGRDVHLLHYPNHECTSVNFSKDLDADNYMYNGKQYVICDPTYIGASIGRCMPNFRKIKPEVEIP